MYTRAVVFCLCATLFSLGTMPVGADDATPISVRVGGEDRSAAQLRELEGAVQAEIKKLADTPAADAEARKQRVDIMKAQATALAGAVQLIERVEKAGEATTALQGKIDRARTAREKAQEGTDGDPADEAELDDARIKDLEGASDAAAQQETDAGNAVTRAEEALKKQRANVDGADARVAELEGRHAELTAALDKTSEDDAAAREALARQIQTNEVRRAVFGLIKAHGGKLVEIDRLARDLAKIEAQIAVAQRTNAAAKLTKARTSYEAELAAEAKRKEEQAARQLREAEADKSPAGAALKRLASLVNTMETDIAEDRQRTMRLKRWVAQSQGSLASAASRLISVELLYPAGGSLESWQREGIAEQQRQLDRDRDDFRRWRADVPDLSAMLANLLTKTARRQVFAHRLEAAADRTERGEDGKARVAAIERELEFARDAEYQRWLTARLDFLNGQVELESKEPTEAERLRNSWQKDTGRLKELVGTCKQELEQHKTSIEALRKSIEDTETALDDRRKHLDRIAFWLQGPSLFSSESFGTAGEEARRVSGQIDTIPEHVSAIRPVGSGRVWIAGLLALGALLGGLWLRRRPDVVRPAEAEPGALVSASWWSVARRVALPGFLVAVSLYVRFRVLPDDPVGTVLVAAFVSWLLFAMSRAIVRAFFVADEHGRVAAGCSVQTAERARTVTRLVFVGSAVLLPLVLLLHAWNAPQLARFAEFAWGLLGVGVGAGFVFRSDVMHLLLPGHKAGSLIARTLAGTLRFLWPLLVLLGAGILTLFALGFHRASIHYSSRGALLLLVIGAIAVSYGLLRLLVYRGRHQALVAAESDDDPEQDAGSEFHLVARLLGALLALGAVIGIWMAVSFILGMVWEDWQHIGAISLTGSGHGAGLTLAELLRATAYLLVGLWIARYVRDLVRVSLRSSNMHMGSRYAIRTLLFYTLMTVASFGALAALGVETSQLGWFLTAAGVGIGFGLQEIISNFISGLILFFERPVQVGDIVTVGDIQGDVTKISIRSTVVRTRDGVSMILPNKKLITEDVVNWSHGDLNTRLNIDIGVAYGSDIKKVREILLRIANEEPQIMRRPTPEVDFRAFGESELTFRLRGWLPTPDMTARRHVRTRVHTRIDEEFAKADITIPFPQRDLHLKSSEIGGLPSDSAPDEAASFERPGGFDT